MVSPPTNLKVISEFHLLASLLFSSHPLSPRFSVYRRGCLFVIYRLVYKAGRGSY